LRSVRASWLAGSCTRCWLAGIPPLSRAVGRIGNQRA
jgi:hypothetical protein